MVIDQQATQAQTFSIYNLCFLDFGQSESSKPPSNQPYHKLTVLQCLNQKTLLDTEGLIPDGVTAFPYKQGKCLTWDFICINTISDSYLLETAKKAGKMALLAEMKKDQKYEKLMPNYYFVTIAIETFGTWGQRGLKFIKEIGGKLQKKMIKMQPNISFKHNGYPRTSKKT